MAQAYVDSVLLESIALTEIDRERVSCRVGIESEIFIKKTRGGVNIYLKEGSKTVSISDKLFAKILQSADSLYLILSFVRGES